MEFVDITLEREGDWYYWTCCDEYYYKTKPGHDRNSNNNLLKDQNDNFVVDYSNGCVTNNGHEE